ncbi:MAG: hypothetical protein HY257_03370 [Chloroflexi bacterium]|nr:hypothetical protein [Chloroflexota bacterium]
MNLVSTRDTLPVGSGVLVGVRVAVGIAIAVFAAVGVEVGGRFCAFAARCPRRVGVGVTARVAVAVGSGRGVGVRRWCGASDDEKNN